LMKSYVSEGGKGPRTRRLLQEGMHLGNLKMQKLLADWKQQIQSSDVRTPSLKEYRSVLLAEIDRVLASLVS
jgi:hypothetical protein